MADAEEVTASDETRKHGAPVSWSCACCGDPQWSSRTDAGDPPASHSGKRGGPAFLVPRRRLPDSGGVVAHVRLAAGLGEDLGELPGPPRHLSISRDCASRRPIEPSANPAKKTAGEPVILARRKVSRDAYLSLGSENLESLPGPLFLSSRVRALKGIDESLVNGSSERPPECFHRCLAHLLPGGPPTDRRQPSPPRFSH